MAGQYGDTRVFTDVSESTDPHKVQCPHCHVNVVPRGATSTRPQWQVNEDKKSCPNCGHVWTSQGYTDPAE